MDKPHSMGLGSPERRYEYDWLTVLAMLTIFLFHCARFFNHEDWHVKNNHLDTGLTYFVAIVAQWIMPLFFLLSGISSNFSLSSRTIGQYLGNRFRRLVIPLLFGSFVFLVPVQVWIERVSHGQFDGGFLAFYPQYFKGFYAFGGNFAWMGLHLWYLEMLFVFTVLTIPLFCWLKTGKLTELIQNAAGFFNKNGVIYLFGIPLFLMECLVNLQSEGAGMRAFGGWSPFSYLIIYIVGYLLAFDPRYMEALKRSRFVSLILGLLLTSLIFFFPIDLTPLGAVGQYVTTAFARSFNSWFWLAAIIGFGIRYLNFSNEFLKYAREAVLPFYILHQTIIVIIGFYIADWEMNVIIKYFILAASSFIVIVVIYDMPVRRINIFRFLFGMKIQK